MLQSGFSELIGDQDFKIIPDIIGYSGSRTQGRKKS
jgi:hypothetical protein